MTFQTWDDRYSTSEYVYGKEPNEFLKSITEFLPHGKVLLLAEGEGRNAVYLAKRNFEVTAWDYSKVALEKCKRLAEESNVHVNTELIDITKAIWIPEEWDVIAGIFSHFYQKDRKRIFAGIKRSLCSGGAFVMEVYSLRQITYASGGPTIPELLYTPEEFLQEFADWDFKHFYYGETERNEGRLHRGKGHVIQIYVLKK